jgi:hypothetical protein
MFREKEKKKKCLYGTEKRQVSLALGKAWTDYFNLSKEQAPDKKSIMHYERVIHKLQGQLRMFQHVLLLLIYVVVVMRMVLEKMKMMMKT